MCARTQVVRRAHTRKLGAHKCSLQKCFSHISYTSFPFQMSSGEMLHNRNFLHTQTLKNEREHWSLYVSSPQRFETRGPLADFVSRSRTTTANCVMENCPGNNIYQRIRHSRLYLSSSYINM